MSDSLIGKQLGDYQIRDLLGRGGMARVYTGYDARLDRLAAVKVINSDFSPADQAEYFERFQREARAIARLNHPNIVGVYQFGQYEDSYYMAMVFIEGRDLRQILREYSDRRELIPAEDVIKVVHGIGSALDYAHERGVIHRDIKPSNIMMTREGNRAILTDFGLALSASEGTRGETFGSAHYIAPEQAISSAKAVPQSDLYSLGICLYEMLTGQVPFDDPSAMTVALKHLQDAPPPPRTINPRLSAGIEHVLLRAIDKDPARRYPSGAELSRALEGAIQDLLLPDTSELVIQDIRNAVDAAAGEAVRPKPVQNLFPDRGVSVAPADPPPAVVKVSPAPVRTTTEVPPPPADAIATEHTESASNPAAALKAVPPLKKSTAIPPALAAPAESDKGRRPVWLLGIVPLVILLLIGGYALLNHNGVLPLANSTATVTATTASTDANHAASLNLTQAALLVSPVMTDAASAENTASPVMTDNSTTAPTMTSSPTETAIATVTASGTAAPTDLPTLTSNSTADLRTTTGSPLLLSTSDPMVTAAATTTLNATSTATSNPVAGTAANGLLLVYNAAELDVSNQTGKTLSLAGLSFNQAGTNRTFAAENWIRTAASLRPGECYQLFLPSSVNVVTSQNLHLISPCNVYQVRAFYGPRYNDSYYFWATIPPTQTPPVTAEPAATAFNVLYNGQTIATCLYSNNRCSFSLPKSGS